MQNKNLGSCWVEWNMEEMFKVGAKRSLLPLPSREIWELWEAAGKFWAEGRYNEFMWKISGQTRSVVPKAKTAPWARWMPFLVFIANTSSGKPGHASRSKAQTEQAHYLRNRAPPGPDSRNIYMQLRSFCLISFWIVKASQSCFLYVKFYSNLLCSPLKMRTWEILTSKVGERQQQNKAHSQTQRGYPDPCIYCTSLSTHLSSTSPPCPTLSYPACPSPLLLCLFLTYTHTHSQAVQSLSWLGNIQSILIVLLFVNWTYLIYFRRDESSLPLTLHPSHTYHSHRRPHGAVVRLWFKAQLCHVTVGLSFLICKKGRFPTS